MHSFSHFFFFFGAGSSSYIASISSRRNALSSALSTRSILLDQPAELARNVPIFSDVTARYIHRYGTANPRFCLFALLPPGTYPRFLGSPGTYPPVFAHWTFVGTCRKVITCFIFSYRTPRSVLPVFDTGARVLRVWSDERPSLPAGSAAHLRQTH